MVAIMTYFFGGVMTQLATNAMQIQKYNLAARLFHWVGALLIVTAWFLVEQGEDFIGLHKAVGFSFLIWTLLRLINRVVSKAPAALPMPAWQTAISHLTHLALYVAMIGMPVTGFLSAYFGGYGVDVFGIFQIAGAAEANRDLARTLMGVHRGLMWNALLALVVLHIGAALYHQFVKKDNLLARMR